MASDHCCSRRRALPAAKAAQIGLGANWANRFCHLAIQPHRLRQLARGAQPHPPAAKERNWLAPGVRTGGSLLEPPAGFLEAFLRTTSRSPHRRRTSGVNSILRELLDKSLVLLRSPLRVFVVLPGRPRNHKLLLPSLSWRQLAAECLHDNRWPHPPFSLPGMRHRPR